MCTCTITWLSDMVTVYLAIAIRDYITAKLHTYNVDYVVHDYGLAIALWLITFVRRAIKAVSQKHNMHNVLGLLDKHW